MNNNILKSKLKVLNSQGIYWVLVDVLSIYQEEIRGAEGLPDEEYAKLSASIVEVLKRAYKKELKPVGKVKQLDLEDSIKEIKDIKNAQ